MTTPVSDSVTNPCAAGTFFTIDLCFALAWSRIAPGLGGWQTVIVQISSGKMIDVIPPRAEFLVFHLLPRTGHVELVHERSIEVGGGQVLVACCPRLRDALLPLCPLSPDGLAATVAGQNKTFAETLLCR